MVATLDLCLTFVECDSPTANVHELQEVNHDCKMQRNGQWKIQCWTCPKINCDPSKSNYVCVWLHIYNESRSESLYEAACLLHKQCGSSRKSGHGANRYVCGLFWPLLRMCTMMHSQLAYLYHGSPAMKCWPFLYYCCSYTIPFIGMTTVSLKLPYIAIFSQILWLDHVCKGRGQRNELLSLWLEVEAILILCNLADSFAKFYSRTFLSLWQFIIYICILALYIYKYSMKVDYVELISVVTG